MLKRISQTRKESVDGVAARILTGAKLMGTVGTYWSILDRFYLVPLLHVHE